MNEAMIEQVVKEVIKNMAGSSPKVSSPSYSGNTVSQGDYPLGEKRPELIKTPSGKLLNDISLDDVIKDRVKADDLRITPETLEMQAQVADSVGRTPLARNLRRAAELTRIPDNRVLEIYNALRPFRSTKADLIAIANELDHQYSAPITANFVREAADVYEKRDRLKKD